MTVTALIPFFGGSSTATNSLEDTRLGYLTRTLVSVKELGWDYRIYQTKKDKVDIFGSVRLDCDPIWLPHTAMVDAQWQYRSSAVWTDPPSFFYVTEADQVVHLADEGVFDLCTDTQYVAPWRLDLVSSAGECESPESPRYKIDGIEYSITNGAYSLVVPPPDPYAGIPIRSAQGSFSGAFLCTAGYFSRIKFRKMRNLPVEHATGLDAKSAGECLKTAEVTRFWIEHLSPRDRWSQEPE